MNRRSILRSLLSTTAAVGSGAIGIIPVRAADAGTRPPDHTIQVAEFAHEDWDWSIPAPYGGHAFIESGMSIGAAKGLLRGRMIDRARHEKARRLEYAFRLSTWRDNPSILVVVARLCW